MSRLDQLTEAAVALALLLATIGILAAMFVTHGNGLVP